MQSAIAPRYLMISYASLGFVTEDTPGGQPSMISSCNMDAIFAQLVKQSNRVSGDRLGDHTGLAEVWGPAGKLLRLRTPQDCSSVFMRALSQVVLGTPQCRNGMGSASGTDPNSVGKTSSSGPFYLGSLNHQIRRRVQLECPNIFELLCGAIDPDAKLCLPGIGDFRCSKQGSGNLLPEQSSQFMRADLEAFWIGAGLPLLPSHVAHDRWLRPSSYRCF